MGVLRASPHGVSIGYSSSRRGGSVARRRHDNGREGSGVAPGTQVFAVRVQRAPFVVLSEMTHIIVSPRCLWSDEQMSMSWSECSQGDRTWTNPEKFDRNKPPSIDTAVERPIMYGARQHRRRSIYRRLVRVTPPLRVIRVELLGLTRNSETGGSRYSSLEKRLTSAPTQFGWTLRLRGTA